MESGRNVLIVGAPSSGKTTLFEALDIPQLQFRVPEMARMIIEGGRFGSSIKEISQAGNFPAFQSSVTMVSAKYESLCEQQDGALVDAGTVSARQYCLDLEEKYRTALLAVIDKHLAKFPPRKVFLCEPLKYRSDGVRHEDPAFQKTIHERFVKYLEESEFDWEPVPAMSLELRVKFVKHSLKKRKA